MIRHARRSLIHSELLAAVAALALAGACDPEPTCQEKQNCVLPREEDAAAVGPDAGGQMSADSNAPDQDADSSDSSDGSSPEADAGSAMLDASLDADVLPDAPHNLDGGADGADVRDASEVDHADSDVVCGSSVCGRGYECIGNACKCPSPKLICGDTCAECCNDFDCAGNQRCSDGTCMLLNCNPCQTANSHACQSRPAGTACGSSKVCVLGPNGIECDECGAEGLSCCTNDICDDLDHGCLIPSQGGAKQCLACGGYLERCCPFGSGCRDGRTCTPSMGGPPACY